MLLIIIAACLVVVITLLSAWAFWDDYDKWSSIFGAFFVSGLLLATAVLAVNVIAMGFTSTRDPVNYTQQLVSIKDGTGIEGQIYGGLFVTQGYVQDTQVFSFYRKEGAGFVLDKRNADRSTVFQDATPETARVDITDSYLNCHPSWFQILCPDPAGQFEHANFHVPANSIKQDFVLDAQ